MLDDDCSTYYNIYTVYYISIHSYSTYYNIYTVYHVSIHSYNYGNIILYIVYTRV